MGAIDSRRRLATRLLAAAGEDRVCCDIDTRAWVAARNNAEWCNLVCRAHGVPTLLDERLWIARRRSPRWYPDAVTLAPDATVDEVLGQIDTGDGCSVKDSFAALDLRPAGLRVLFEAEWIHRPPPPDSALPETWRSVDTPEELRAWAAWHGGGDVFVPQLLTDPRVAILAGHDGGAMVSGAIGSLGASVAGVSNVFTSAADLVELWREAPRAIACRFPGLPLVGYQAGPALEAALRNGFAAVGPLRVWVK